MQERNKTLFVIRNPQPATCGVYDGTPYRGNQGRAFWTRIFSLLPVPDQTV